MRFISSSSASIFSSRRAFFDFGGLLPTSGTRFESKRNRHNQRLDLCQADGRRRMSSRTNPGSFTTPFIAGT
jgi:hypothetical protein